MLDSSKSARKVMLEESFTLALREGDFKYIAPFEGNTPDWLMNKAVESGLKPEGQLFDLSSDATENINIIDKMPERARAMQTKIEAIVSQNSYK
ncbi:hypothetical protein L3081_20935 [Colwellia sp. MSW7]|uniref:Uncharacterized protein n=1 Tax=Colwellia maritima TaxID=2912588 RepID=A0ABS9X583_9GAMM|nr:hypothetical protein [Colwellia maritima]